MNLETWLGQRRPVWKRLEAIVDKIVRSGPHRTGGQNIAELIEVYQSACADWRGCGRSARSRRWSSRSIAS